MTLCKLHSTVAKIPVFFVGDIPVACLSGWNTAIIIVDRLGAYPESVLCNCHSPAGYFSSAPRQWFVVSG